MVFREILTPCCKGLLQGRRRSIRTSSFSGASRNPYNERRWVLPPYQCHTVLPNLPVQPLTNHGAATTETVLIITHLNASETWSGPHPPYSPPQDRNQPHFPSFSFSFAYSIPPSATRIHESDEECGLAVHPSSSTSTLSDSVCIRCFRTPCRISGCKSFLQPPHYCILSRHRVTHVDINCRFCTTYQTVLTT